MCVNDAHQARIMAVLAQAKALARDYRALTGKPLGITGEVAEYEAARLLGVTLTPARHAGYDAVGKDGRTFQIKGRCMLPDCKPGQRLGSIDVEKEFDAVLMCWLTRTSTLSRSTKRIARRCSLRSRSLAQRRATRAARSA